MADGAMARLGRWCFTHRWWVLAGWLVAVAAGVLSAGPVFAGLSGDNHPTQLESVKAFEVLDTGSTTDGTVVGLVDAVEPAAAGVSDATTRAAADIAAMPGVNKVAQPFDRAAPPAVAKRLLAADGRGLIISVELGTFPERADRDTRIDAIGDRLDQLNRDLKAAGQPDATVRLGGQPQLNREINAAVQADLSRAELISLPLTLVVLVLVFGGLIAAGLPVLAAVVSVATAMVVLLGFSLLTDLDQNVVTVVTLLGLGLSVDYGLLLVARYREELGAGFDPLAAVSRAWATAGRTILFSALTVAAALSGLLMFGMPALSALGAAGVSIALVAMLAALTFTAAMLGLARNRIKPARPSRRSRKALRAGTEPAVAPDEASGFFARLAQLVQRRALLVALGTGAVLLVAGLPLLHTTLKLARLEAVPDSLRAKQVAEQLAEQYGQEANPAVTVVARTDPATLDRWAQQWRDDPAVSGVEAAKPGPPSVSYVHINVAGDSQGDQARELVDRVRAGRPPGVESWVTGDAAILTDLLGVIVDGLPLALGTTLVAMVLLLFAMTGSLVIPVKAILANVISLGATFGVMNAVFEQGYGSGVLRTLTTGGLDPFVIVIIFAFAFGLSMDYEVFLLGRIREYVEQGESTDRAVRHGLQHTGRIITSAALLMVIVFGCFAAAKVGSVEQVGVGLTVAVLIDATIVRCLLVPATMTLLGRWNWWAPAPLRRLHERIGLREHPLPPADPASAGLRQPTTPEPEPARIG